MNLIQIEGMEFYAYHGCYAEERIVGNKFVIDLAIETNVNRAIQSDNINDTINYQRVYEHIKDEMAVKSYLLEHIAGRIIQRICANFAGIENITIKVSKLNPPMGGKISAVSFTMSKKN